MEILFLGAVIRIRKPENKKGQAPATLLCSLLRLTKKEQTNLNDIFFKHYGTYLFLKTASTYPMFYKARICDNDLITERHRNLKNIVVVRSNPYSDPKHCLELGK